MTPDPPVKWEGVRALRFPPAPPALPVLQDRSRCDSMSARPPSARTNLAGVINTGRVTAVSIAAYDYILTLPAEYRFYKAFYHNHFRLSTNLVLFVLIRYISILTIALGCIGFWGTFTPEACRRYYLLPTLARVVQSMVSQAILGLRAYGISRKNSTVGIVLLSSYILATAVSTGIIPVWPTPQAPA